MDEPVRILVVDDEQIIRDGCTRILQKMGHSITTAGNGQDALDKIRSVRYHIVLLDIKMPVLDGMEVMDVLKREQPDLLIVVITGHATIETAVEAMKAGAYDLLLKPFSADALKIAVNRALDHLNLAWEAERLRQEKERSLIDIANEQSRIRTIVNSMACGILVTDNERNIALVNPIAPRMLGMDAESVIGRPMEEVTPQEKLIEMTRSLFNDKKTEYTAIEQELEIGDETYIRARAAPVRDAEGAIIGVVTVLQDISHLKELDKMKSEFVTMVSHELKAPLAAIQQQIDVLLAGIAGDINDKQDYYLSRAKSRTKGLINLINELLDLSKIESGCMIFKQEPLDLAPLIRLTVDFLKPQAESRRQTLLCNIPESLPNISADPQNMDEVFINLINNAIKYTPEGGTIKIVSEVAGDYVKITISDTGYGIRKEDLARIFDKFFRVKTDATRSIAGTGLGLPIVKGIVEAHLGTITVSSLVGQGSSFVIQLPILKI